MLRLLNGEQALEGDGNERLIRCTPSVDMRQASWPLGCCRPRPAKAMAFRTWAQRCIIRPPPPAGDAGPLPVR